MMVVFWRMPPGAGGSGQKASGHAHGVPQPAEGLPNTFLLASNLRPVGQILNNKSCTLVPRYASQQGRTGKASTGHRAGGMLGVTS